MRCTVFVIVILSVCLSVCLSVTFVHCVNMVWPTIMISSPYGSPIILVSGDVTLIPKFEGRGGTPREGVEWGWGGYELAIFDQQAAVSPKRWDIRQRLLLITNRISNTRFRLVPKSTTWLTMKWPWTAIMHSVALHTCVSELTTKICMKIDPYYQRQKCSPAILLSSKVRFMRIFAGVRWRGGVKCEWVLKNGNCRFFCSLYLPNLHIQGHLYYIVLCSPLVALQWYQNRWPCMTLNGHFALKSVSGSATNGLASPAFGQTVRKLAELPIYFQRQKYSPGNVVSGKKFLKSSDMLALYK